MDPQMSGFQKPSWNWAKQPNVNTQNSGRNPVRLVQAELGFIMHFIVSLNISVPLGGWYILCFIVYVTPHLHHFL